jgi:hypothetical protein
MMRNAVNFRRALAAMSIAGLLGLVACQSAGNLPAVQSPLNSPMPTSAARRAPVDAGPTVTPDASKGLVTGVIKLRVNGEPTPVPGLIVYLGDQVSDGAGNKTGVSFDRVNSMRSITDEEGRFTFRNVPPGEFGLVLDAVRDAYMLKNPSNNQDLLIKVEAGKTADFGELVYEQLPVTPMP